MHVKERGLEDLPDTDSFCEQQYEACKLIAGSDSNNSNSNSSSINGNGNALVAYCGFAATRDGIRFNGWHKNPTERANKLRRFQAGLVYLRKYLLHEKVCIIAPQDVLAMPVPSTPTLYYIDPPTTPTTSTAAPTLKPGRRAIW